MHLIYTRRVAQVFAAKIIKLRYVVCVEMIIARPVSTYYLYHLN